MHSSRQAIRFFRFQFPFILMQRVMERSAGKFHPQLPLNGGLNTRTIQNFALDCQGSEGFGAHRLDRQLVTVLFAQVLDGAQQHADDEILPFRRRKVRNIP